MIEGEAEDEDPCSLIIVSVRKQIIYDIRVILPGSVARYVQNVARPIIVLDDPLSLPSEPIEHLSIYGFRVLLPRPGPITDVPCFLPLAYSLLIAFYLGDIALLLLSLLYPEADITKGYSLFEQ
jgi:hypothetical protein